MSDPYADATAMAYMEGMSRAKFCGACGATIDPANCFCRSCGTSLPSSSHDASANDGTAIEGQPPATDAPVKKDIPFGIVVAFIVFVGALIAIVIVAVDGLSNGALTSVVEQGPAKTVGDSLKAQVAGDAAKEYALIPATDKMSRCVHAQATAEAYLQAQDQENYQQWHTTQGLDCALAGVPQ